MGRFEIDTIDLKKIQLINLEDGQLLINTVNINIFWEDIKKIEEYKIVGNKCSKITEHNGEFYIVKEKYEDLWLARKEYINQI